MIKVIGVRFRRAGKVYYFNPLDMDITTGMHVIVETARGVEYGYVVLGVKDMDEEKVFQPLKPVIRIATPQDDAVADENRQKEKDAFKICQEKIAKHGLDMKLIDAEYTFDNNKVLFYFTADGRVDFRELVKDLASVFRTRIELRQIGVRDEAKIIGGIGSLTSLDFLGFGLEPPTPSWGELMSQGLNNLYAPWISISTVLALFVTLLLTTFVGEGVRNAMDPKSGDRYE